MSQRRSVGPTSTDGDHPCAGYARRGRSPPVLYGCFVAKRLDDAAVVVFLQDPPSVVLNLANILHPLTPLQATKNHHRYRAT